MKEIREVCNSDVNSHFDIRTGFVHVNNSETDDDVFVEDLFRTTIGEKPNKTISIIGPLEKTARNHFQTLLHETVHWWQYTGTNFGSFIFYLHHQNMGATVGSFVHLEKAEKDALLQKRFNKRPIIDGNSNPYDLCNGQLGSFEEAAFTSQANRLVLGIIQNNAFEKFKELAHPIFIRDTFTQCMHWLRSNENKEKGPIKINWDETPYDFKQIVLVRSPFGDIGLPNLIEGQARALQALFLINRLKIETSEEVKELTLQKIESFIEAPSDSEYMRAYHYFQSYTQDSVESFTELQKSLTHFVILCDISLSSPSPMDMKTYEQDSLKWEDIYPPTRFFKLLTCSAEHNFDYVYSQCRKTKSQEGINDWARKICILANIPFSESTNDTENPEFAKNLDKKWDARVLLDELDEEGPNIYEFILDANRLHQHLRVSNKNLFVELCLNPELILSQLFAAKISDKVIGKEYRMDSHSIIFPPSIWDHAEDGENQVSGLGKYLTAYTMLSCIAENFFFSNKPILDIPFPDYILQEEGLKKALLVQFGELVGISYSDLEKMAY